MTLKTLLFAAATSASLLIQPIAAGAQGAPAASTDPATVMPGVYKLETNHARVLWGVSHLAFSEWYGNFSHVTGMAKFDPKNPAANSVEITIPTESVTTTNTTLDGELKSADWFDAAKFPTITFKSTAVRPTGPGMADVTGDLTLHGVTKPVTMKVKFRGSGMNPMSKHFALGFDGTTSIKRSDFGVTKFVGMIGDQVDITISAPFEREG